MTTYLLTAAGVIFISVIVSLIIPEGKLNKTITFVMRLICIMVLIQPITGVFKLGDGKTVEANYEYVSTAYSRHQSGQLEKLINSKFGIDSECNIYVEYSDGEFKVTKVEVAVSENNKNLIDDIYEYLKELNYINITVYAKST